jgi:hypothetical protein
MADDSDLERIDGEQRNEEDEEVEPVKEKKVFINHLDSYHGKNIARVSKSH